MFGKKEEARVTKLAAWVDSLHDKLNRVENIQRLILSEMNLTYQPETEKKEPARLVEYPPRDVEMDWGYDDCLRTIALYKPEAKKKKRGRPKKK